MGKTDRGGRDRLRCVAVLGPTSESQGMCSARRNVQSVPGQSRGSGRTGRGSGSHSQPQSIPEPLRSGTLGEPGAQLPRTPTQDGETLCGQGELGLRVGRRGGEGLLGFATLHPGLPWFRPRRPARPPPASPSPGPPRSPGAPGDAAPASGGSGFRPLGSRKRESGSDRGTGDRGRGAGLAGRGRGHARRGGAGGC